MKHLIPLLALSLALGGCAQIKAALSPGGGSPRTAPENAAPSASPVPTAGASSADALDTTTEAERAAATAPPSGGERLLGETVASLGDATEPGLWAATPLVDATVQGRLVYPANGKSARVELRPRDAEPGAGSQVSLAALRLLEAPLTDLPVLQVYGP